MHAHSKVAPPQGFADAFLPLKIEWIKTIPAISRPMPSVNEPMVEYWCSSWNSGRYFA